MIGRPGAGQRAALLNRRKCRSGLLGAPDDPQTVGGDPLLLLAHQTLFAAEGEELVEALAGTAELGLLDVENGLQLTLPFHALLVGHSHPAQAHTHHQGQAGLDAEGDEAAGELALFAGQGNLFAPFTQGNLGHGSDLAGPGVWRKRAHRLGADVAPLLAALPPVAKGQRHGSSGLEEAEAETDGQNAGMGGDDEGDQHLGLAQHGHGNGDDSPILRPVAATVQLDPVPCHSS